MQPAAERTAEQHVDDLFDQLAQTRQRHGIHSQVLDRHLDLHFSTTRQREHGIYLRVMTLTELAAWSRTLGLGMHLSDQYGRVLPAWMPQRPPHDTSAAFEARRLTRNLDLRRAAIPCDLAVLVDHLHITAAAWQTWIEGTAAPNLLTITRACIALDVRITLTPMWHEQCLTSVRAMQAESESERSPPSVVPK